METVCPESPKHASAAETIANHDDLLSLILIRLEAKSLIRYKSVSKHWLSLISSPKFRDRHTLRNPNPPVSAFFFLSTKQDLTFISLPDGDGNRSGSRSNPLGFVPELNGVKILQSCNGLLLCRSGGEEKSRGRRGYYVVNPTSSQFSKLPSTPYVAGYPSYDYQLDDCLAVALAFDPYKTGKFHYKVVALWLTNVDTVGIGIYASETRSWSVGMTEVYFEYGQVEVDFGHGVYCNGAIHWLTHKDELFYCRIGGGLGEDAVRDGLVASPLECLW